MVLSQVMRRFQDILARDQLRYIQIISKVDCSIEYSMQLNASRIKVLQAQDDLVNSMKESASKELLRVSENSSAYRKLLKDLIVQSLLRLKEPSVLLRCREMDAKLVKSILAAAEQEYAEKAKVHPPKITIDENVYLPPPPGGAKSHGPSWTCKMLCVHAQEALRRAKLKFPGRQKIIVSRKWGFTKFSRTDYVRWKSENRIVPDGVNAKLLGCHGPLANRQPGRAFLDATKAS